MCSVPIKRSGAQAPYCHPSVHLQLSADTHERTAAPAFGKTHGTSCKAQADAEQPATPRRSTSPADPSTRTERVVGVTLGKKSKCTAIRVFNKDSKCKRKRS